MIQRRVLLVLVSACGAVLAQRAGWLAGVDEVRPRDLPPELGTDRGGYVVETTTDAVYDSRQSLASLAEPGVYTVIGITSRQCSLSQGIRRGMPAFLARRKDVVFKNVEDFSGTMSFASVQEGQAWIAKREAIRDTYRIDFGPKVVIFGPDLQPIVGDRAPKGRGYHVLHAWMQAHGSLR